VVVIVVIVSVSNQKKEWDKPSNLPDSHQVEWSWTRWRHE